MSTALPADLLSRLQNGRVRAIGTAHPSASLAELEANVEEETASTRVVGLRLGQFLTHDHLLKDSVRYLASAALSLWPDWYGADVSNGQSAKVPQGVSPLWRGKAKTLASVGQLPLPAKYPAAFQVAQLALILGRPGLVIAIATPDGAMVPLVWLTSLVATATWLATQSKAKTVLFVSHDALKAEEFNRVEKECSIQIEFESPATPWADDRPSVTITSINGRPNPTSPGEVLLAKKLASDDELKGIFHFNKTLRSIHGKDYAVDLVWPAGGLVIEVDGYTFHSSRFAFGQDRHRDYELLISGYRVLRLTHEEIVKDTEKAIAKIRDSVRYFKKNIFHGN